VIADSISAALLIVLETLTPSERVAFVLHDMFDLPFEDIAPIVGRSSSAARQLASRARRRVQGRTASAAERDRKREIVGAFLAAARGGDFQSLLSLLDPNMILRGAPEGEVRGGEAVAKFFSGRAKAAQPADIDGTPGLVWAPGGKPRVVFSFTTKGDHIVAIDLIGGDERLAKLDIAIRS